MDNTPALPATETSKAGAASNTPLVMLALLGFVQLLLLAGFTFLYVNFPEGYDVAYGLNHSAGSIFRGIVEFPSLVVTADSFRRAALLTVLGLWLCYFGGLLLTERVQQGTVRRWGLAIVVAASGVFNLALALAMPPMLSVDVYHYALHGRMASLHGLNPYLVSGDAVPADPFWLLSPYRAITTEYGPTWTLLAAGVTRLAAGDVSGTMMGFKLLAASANLVNGLLVMMLARQITGGYGLVALLLYAWNPIILLETAGSGHNEAVMLMLALLGLWLVVNERLLAGAVFVALSVGVKYATILLAPLVVAYLLAHSSGRSEGWKRAGLFIGAVAAALFVLALPFGGSGVSLDRVLLPLAASRNVMPNPLWTALDATLQSIASPLPFGWRPDTWLFLLLALALGLATVGLAWLAATRRWPWSRLVFVWAALTFCLYYIVRGGSFTWYLVIPLAAAAVMWGSREARLTWAVMVALAISATVLFYAVPLAQGR